VLRLKQTFLSFKIIATRKLSTMTGSDHYFIVLLVWKSSNMYVCNNFPERKKSALQTQFNRSGVGSVSALFPSFPSPFPASLDELYFSGSHFTTGEIPFVNLTSDSYKFFRVSLADVDGRSFLIRLLPVRRRRKYFRDPAFVKHSDVKNASRCNRGVHSMEYRSYSVIHQNPYVPIFP